MKYLCFDTALNEEYTLVKLLQRYPVRMSLFAGTDDESIWDAAPWLFEVEDNFFELRQDRLTQLDHCILFETQESIQELCRFLQLYIYDRSDDKIKYLRVWDARVLLSQLQAWQPSQRKSFFEGITFFYTESSQTEYFNRWEPGNKYYPMATKFLKTEVLKTLPGDVGFIKPSINIKEENIKEEEIESKDLPAPKRRRFFID